MVTSLCTVTEGGDPAVGAERRPEAGIASCMAVTIVWWAWHRVIAQSSDLVLGRHMSAEEV